MSNECTKQCNQQAVTTANPPEYTQSPPAFPAATTSTNKTSELRRPRHCIFHTRDHGARVHGRTAARINQIQRHGFFRLLPARIRLLGRCAMNNQSQKMQAQRRRLPPPPLRLFTPLSHYHIHIQSGAIHWRQNKIRYAAPSQLGILYELLKPTILYLRHIASPPSQRC